jgi:hypothetical protein
LERNPLNLNLHQLSIMGVSEMKYGYARVSSKGQDYTAQVEALKAAGCERIFSEKASAKNTDGRPEFLKLLKVLLPGDRRGDEIRPPGAFQPRPSARTGRPLLRLRIPRGKLVRHHD